MNFSLYLLKTFRISLFVIAFFGAIGVGAGAYLWWNIFPDLPSIQTLKDVQLQVPLRVYSADNAAIAEFGEQRRTPLPRSKMPEMLINAVLAIEDARFYDHPGVDWKSLLRAAVHLLQSGEIQQGGSTITMQVARNFFLTPERTMTRKLREIILALRIETELTKDEILELYLNKIFFGNRAYGVAAAAQIYYGKSIEDLSLAQYAVLAGLPKAPSANNPLANPERALERRNYILKRMLELAYINDAQYQQAVVEPLNASTYAFPVELDAPYLAEMVRAQMVEKYGEGAYTSGYKVFTSVTMPLQNAAQYALRKTLLEYETRYGYRGGVKQLKIPSNWLKKPAEELSPLLNELLADTPSAGGLLPAIVVELNGKTLRAYTREMGFIDIEWKGLSWARRYNKASRRTIIPKNASDVAKVGEVIYALAVLEPEPKKPAKPKNNKKKKEEKPAEEEAIAETPPEPKYYWRLAQIPEVAGALVALNPNNGAVLAVMGGFDFYQSKFNRVTQAERQPGSSFKPFIYSAALAHGFSPSSVVNDAPIVHVYRTGSGIKVWRPSNYSGGFYGPTSLRNALAYSRNLAAVRLLDTLSHKIGMKKVIEYVSHFGFDPSRLPANLTLALGTPSLTPMEMVRGFAVFANGGYLIEPYFVERIEDFEGNIIYQHQPTIACHGKCEQKPAAVQEESKVQPVSLETSEPAIPEQPVENYAPRVITAQNAWLMTSMMKDVIKSGTARKALVLKRQDLAGKTGTTNDQRDVWFSGYNADIVATAWIGYDQPRSLGNREAGGRTALPMWIDFVREALKDKPLSDIPLPSGLVTARIRPGSGLLAQSDDSSALMETFESGNAPRRYASPSSAGGTEKKAVEKTVREQLF